MERPVLVDAPGSEPDSLAALEERADTTFDLEAAAANLFFGEARLAGRR